MLKKYLTKFTVDILPSVAATVIGAYIVNHYIVAKPGSDAPVAAAVSTADPKAEAKGAPVGAKSETSSDVANIPEAGVKAKGISEKAILDKSAAEKPQEKSGEKSGEKAGEKPAEKSADRPAETAAAPAETRPAETRRHQPAPREKAVAKAVQAPAQPAAPTAPAVVPVVAAAPAEAASAVDERRDANDLARAAIERLRGATDGSARPDAPPRAQDAARTSDAPRVVTAPPVSAPSVRPLPPPIMVSTPAAETFDQTAGSSQARPPYAASARTDDPRRPTPPADIPLSRPPLDLRAEAAEPSAREHTSVADDMLSAAKSVFHAVLPK
jgi:hypothetical protein